MTQKKILILGAYGFIGMHLQKALKKRYNIYVPTKKKLNLNNKIKLYDYIKNLNPHYIIHLASRTVSNNNHKKEKYFQKKYTFLTIKNVIDSINKDCKLIIFFGSIAEYGSCHLPFKESSIPQPLTYYGYYKYQAYKYLLKIHKIRKFNYLWLRPSLVYGAGTSKKRFLGYLVDKIKKNRPIIMSGGSQTRDYLYIYDLIKIILLILKKKKQWNCILNLSSNNRFRLNSVIFKVEKILKKKIAVIIKKNKKNFDLYNSNNKLLNIFPGIKFTKFDDGLKKIFKNI